MRSVLAVVAFLVLAPTGAAAARPSPSACAVAWNRSAGPRLHAIVAAGSVRAAFVSARASIGIDTWSKAGRRRSTSSLGCSIRFVLPNGRLLDAWGAWRHGVIPDWHGPIASGRVVPVPHNARVHRDGTVGFTG
jgi:hypothetical protein